MNKESVERLKERLAVYVALQRDIDLQIERLERMEAAMEAPASPSLTRLPRGSGGTDKIGRMMERKEQLQADVSAAIERERAEHEALEELIRNLEDPDERTVIRTRYFDREEWTEIASTLFPDMTIKTNMNRVYRLHRKALEGMAATLDVSKQHE